MKLKFDEWTRNYGVSILLGEAIVILFAMMLLPEFFHVKIFSMMSLGILFAITLGLALIIMFDESKEKKNEEQKQKEKRGENE